VAEEERRRRRHGRAQPPQAEKLYAAIDGSQFYRNSVAKDSRSWMNVTFTLARPELDLTFLEHAAEAGLKNLKGIGYTAVCEPACTRHALAGVDALVAFMREFERRPPETLHGTP